mmetsp:Transcript_127472/g.302881  ORF Transcript_127472/g.302881 Transcript_127472/m.302881 type:complete len:263 (-) Transcript_127472:112-900(-)
MLHVNDFQLHLTDVLHLPLELVQERGDFRLLRGLHLAVVLHCCILRLILHLDLVKGVVLDLGEHADDIAGVSCTALAAEESRDLLLRLGIDAAGTLHRAEHLRHGLGALSLLEKGRSSLRRTTQGLRGGIDAVHDLRLLIYFLHVVVVFLSALGGGCFQRLLFRDSVILQLRHLLFKGDNLGLLLFDVSRRDGIAFCLHDVLLQLLDGTLAVAVELLVEIRLLLCLRLDLLRHLLHHGDHLADGIPAIGRIGAGCDGGTCGE